MHRTLKDRIRLKAGNTKCESLSGADCISPDYLALLEGSQQSSVASEMPEHRRFIKSRSKNRNRTAAYVYAKSDTKQRLTIETKTLSADPIATFVLRRSKTRSQVRR